MTRKPTDKTLSQELETAATPTTVEPSTEGQEDPAPRARIYAEWAAAEAEREEPVTPNWLS